MRNNLDLLEQAEIHEIPVALYGAGKYGRIALTNILGEEYKITASRGKIIEKKGITYIPTWHPAALLRDETKKIDFWNDLKLAISNL